MLFWYIVDHAKHGKCSEAFVFDQNRKLRARNVAKIPSSKRLYWCRGIASKVDVEQELHAYVHEDIHAPVGVKFQVLFFLGLIFAAVRVLASTLPNHVCFRSAKPAGDHAPNRSVLAHAHRLVRAQARSGTSRPGGNGKDGDLEGFGEGVVRSQYLFQFFLVVCSWQLQSLEPRRQPPACFLNWKQAWRYQLLVLLSRFLQVSTSVMAPY